MCAGKELMPSAWMLARQELSPLTLKKDLYGSIAKNAMVAKSVSVPVLTALYLCIRTTASFINVIFAGAGLFSSVSKPARERL
jgi:hypothetical protein